MYRTSSAGSKPRKALLTALIVGGLGAVAGLGTFSAFTATTTNTGNAIASGTVKIDQHAGAATFYSLTNQGPGTSNAKCVRITYTGTLASSVKMYVSSGVTNGANYNLKIERGSGLSGPAADMNCTGFTASSTAFDAGLDTLGTSYAAGVDGKAAAAAWAENDALDYRFTINVVDDSTPNAHVTSNSTGSHVFTWEARNN
jgi:hypothetical protein